MNYITAILCSLLLLACTPAPKPLLLPAKDFDISLSEGNHFKKNDTIDAIPIAIRNPDYRLSEAFFDYSICDTTVVDTTNHVILIHQGIHLPLRGNEAIYSLITGTATGTFRSPEFTLIARDKNKMQHYQTFSFDYTVE